MKQEVLLWSGLLLAPIAWFVSLEANFAFAPLTCSGQGLLAVRVVSIVALLAAIFSAALSWTQFYAPAQDPPGRVVVVTSRKRAMALGGIVLSGLFTVTIAAQGIPNFMLEGCG